MSSVQRDVDDHTYLKYLFQSLNLDKLKVVCKDFNIKGYSKFKKSDLIEFILDSLSEEEIGSLIKKKEKEIVSEGIASALEKINGKNRESITSIKVINPETHEIELKFKGFNWNTESYLIINDQNLNNPDRDCDCRTGAEMGFCPHFWVGFIFTLKKGFFNLKDWTLTYIPDGFEKEIQSINISNLDALEGVKLVDKSSDDYLYQKYLDQSITIYEAEVTNIEEKEQVFQENVTKYYLGSLKDIKLGPRVQRKDDFNESDLSVFKELSIRISEKLQEELNLKPRDKISLNGKLTKDNFLKLYVVKNIRKINLI
jgi:hypothetical protein